MDRIPATRRVIHVIGQSGRAHGTSASTLISVKEDKRLSLVR